MKYGIGRSRFWVVMLGCNLCFVSSVLGDTIVLKGGQRLTGDILVEKESLLYIDIGVDVVAVPKEQIRKFEYAGDEQELAAETVDANDPNGLTDASLQRTGQLYRTANLRKMTIERCVETFGEA
ncbi:MAG: hypothetical protein ACYS29_13020, partial [Planctomycetota bacterium]